jgi:hypothetical protein
MAYDVLSLTQTLTKRPHFPQALIASACYHIVRLQFHAATPFKCLSITTTHPRSTPCHAQFRRVSRLRRGKTASVRSAHVHKSPSARLTLPHDPQVFVSPLKLAPHFGQESLCELTMTVVDCILNNGFGGDMWFDGCTGVDGVELCIG